MRLSCPNCNQTYHLPDGALPQAGQHVQCSACHTRWFAKGRAPAPKLSEEEILANLDARRGGRKLSLVAGAATAPARDPEEADEDAPFDWVAPSGEPEHAAPATRANATEPEAETLRPEAEPPKRAGGRTKADHPTPHERRLDLTRPPEPHRAPLPSARKAPPRFLDGVLLVLVLAFIAGALYAFAAEIARGLPPVAVAVEAYAGAIERIREWFADLGG